MRQLRIALDKPDNFPYELPPGQYIIRSFQHGRGKLWLLTLIKAATLLDEVFVDRPFINKRRDYLLNNQAGDWTIDVNGQLCCISTDGPFGFEPYVFKGMVVV